MGLGQSNDSNGNSECNQGVLTMDELLSDPLSKRQRQYLIQKWIREASIFGEMESTLILAVIEYSGSTMTEKLQNLSLSYHEKKLRMYSHTDLYGKGVVTNAPTDTMYSGISYDAFFYEVKQEDAHHFVITDTIKAGAALYDFTGHCLRLNWENMLGNHFLLQQRVLIIGQTTFVLSELILLLYNEYGMRQSVVDMT